MPVALSCPSGPGGTLPHNYRWSPRRTFAQCHVHGIRCRSSTVPSGIGISSLAGTTRTAPSLTFLELQFRPSSGQNQDCLSKGPRSEPPNMAGTPSCMPPPGPRRTATATTTRASCKGWCRHHQVCCHHDPYISTPPPACPMPEAGLAKTEASPSSRRRNQ